jgi:anti-sigma-K factor RskA
MTDVTGRRPAELTCDEVRDLAEGFVLDALDADEAAAVRAHLASCPDPHAEVSELAAALPILDASVPLVEPPAGLGARIRAAAAADLAARTSTPGVADAPVRIDRAPSARPRPSTGGWALRIAAVLAIVVLGGMNLFLLGQLSTARTYEANVAAVLDVAAQPGALTAILSAEGGDGPVGLAAVDANGTAVMAMRDLPATTGGQVYQAWVIAADGVPVPLGGFTVGADGIAYFEGIELPTEPGIVLALTLEPAPGATTPTLPIVSSGTATAAG